MDRNKCTEMVDACEKHEYCDTMTDLCAPCFSLCSDRYKTEEECHKECPDYVLPVKGSHPSALPEKPQDEFNQTTNSATLNIIISVIFACITVMLIILIICTAKELLKSRKHRKKLTHPKGYDTEYNSHVEVSDEKRCMIDRLQDSKDSRGILCSSETQLPDDRAILETTTQTEFEYKDSASAGSLKKTNPKSLISKSSMVSQCTDDLQTSLPGIQSSVNMDPTDVQNNQHRVINNNLGTKKTHLKIKTDKKPMNQSISEESPESPSAFLPSETSTFPKILRSLNPVHTPDESTLSPPLGFIYTTPNDNNIVCHNIAENSPFLDYNNKTKQTDGKDAPRSIVQIPHQLERAISLERQHSDSTAPEQNQTTEISPLLLQSTQDPRPASQSQGVILLVSDVGDQCHMISDVIRIADNMQEFSNTRTPIHNRGNEQSVAESDLSLNLLEDSLTSGAVMAANSDNVTDISDHSTPAERRQRWEMVMRMNDEVTAKRFPFVAGCVMSDEALQVFVRPTSKLDLAACYRQILNAVPRDAPEHMLVVDRESSSML